MEPEGYKVTVERGLRILGCLRPAVLVLNATVPIDWQNLEEGLLTLGYSILRARTDAERETTARRLGKRSEYVAVLTQEEDHEHLQEWLGGLFDERYSYVYCFPNNQRQYRAWRQAETVATVREELARNERCWRDHCLRLGGDCFTILL